MGRNYKFKDPEGVYFVSFAIVECMMQEEKDNLTLRSFEACRRAIKSRRSITLQQRTK